MAHGARSVAHPGVLGGGPGARLAGGAGLLNAAGIALDAALLGGLRVMEREVVRVWRERREREPG